MLTLPSHSGPCLPSLWRANEAAASGCGSRSSSAALFQPLGTDCGGLAACSVAAENAVIAQRTQALGVYRCHVQVAGSPTELESVAPTGPTLGALLPVSRGSDRRPSSGVAPHLASNEAVRIGHLDVWLCRPVIEILGCETAGILRHSAKATAGQWGCDQSSKTTTPPLPRVASIVLVVWTVRSITSNSTRAARYGYSLTRRNRVPGTRSAIRSPDYCEQRFPRESAFEREVRILACRPRTGAGLSRGACAEDLSDFRSQAIYGKRFRQHGHAGR
jgi:hypothetical protein